MGRLSLNTKQSLIAAQVATLMAVTTCGATKYAGEFLALGAGGRSVGMGSAFCAVANDASAPYWNPAGCAMVNGRSILLMHAESFGGLVHHEYISFVNSWSTNGKPAGLGVSLLYLGVDDIPITDRLSFHDYGIDGLPDTGDEGEGNGSWEPNEPVIYDETKIQWLDDAEMAGFASYAFSITPSILIGLNAKVIHKSVGKYTANGFGADIGSLVHLSPHVTMAVKLQDISSTVISWSTGTRDHITPSVRLGGQTTHQITAFESSITVAFDAHTYFENRRTASWASLEKIGLNEASMDLHMGAEYWYRDLLAFRMGWVESDTGYLTFGLGLAYKALGVDFAIIEHDVLGNGSRLSGSLTF
jgi:hypothetical protein